MLEAGYRTWLRDNLPRIRPEHVTDVIELPIEDEFSPLFVTGYNSRGESTGFPISMLKLVYPDPSKWQSMMPMPRHIWLHWTAKAIKRLEDRMLIMEKKAPLYFALNCSYPGRPTSLPPPTGMKVARVGPRWLVVALDRVPRRNLK
jgi:hypothetical protein